jgi:hypothetical protein
MTKNISPEERLELSTLTLGGSRATIAPQGQRTLKLCFWAIHRLMSVKTGAMSSFVNVRTRAMQTGSAVPEFPFPGFGAFSFDDEREVRNDHHGYIFIYPRAFFARRSGWSTDIGI